ncbi:MAG: winged helix-turn-helix transcriptional regulator [Candidatus Diapherotrites archaeon]
MRYQDPLEEALRLEIRRKIYETIKENPGLHFRELQRRTGIATGALQYHLDYFVKRHLVKTEREKKFLRYYLVREKFDETKLMSFLRQDKIRKVLLFLSKRRYSTLEKIVSGTGLNETTVQNYIHSLIKDNVLEEKAYSGKVVYSIKEKEKIAELLRSYRKSFLDALVDEFVEMWGEI